MADIFLSYSRKDLLITGEVARLLQAKGWSVWSDARVPIGKTFDAIIEAALNEAKCVIVLWSTSSVQSDWVKAEAAEGKRRGILVPVLIDDVRIPLEFSRLQTLRLPRCDGDLAEETIAELAAAVSQIVHGPETKKDPESSTRGQEQRPETSTPEYGVEPKPGLRKRFSSWPKVRPVAALVVVLAASALLVLVSLGRFTVAGRSDQAELLNRKSVSEDATSLSPVSANLQPQLRERLDTLYNSYLAEVTVIDRTNRRPIPNARVDLNIVMSEKQAILEGRRPILKSRDFDHLPVATKTDDRGQAFFAVREVTIAEGVHYIVSASADGYGYAHGVVLRFPTIITKIVTEPGPIAFAYTREELDGLVDLHFDAKVILELARQ